MRDTYSESIGHPEYLTLKEVEELSEVQCNRTLKIRFRDLSLDKFWIFVKEEYPTIHREAIDTLMQFSSKLLLI